jgi:hypothetical protein
MAQKRTNLEDTNPPADTKINPLDLMKQGDTTDTKTSETTADPSITSSTTISSSSLSITASITIIDEIMKESNTDLQVTTIQEESNTSDVYSQELATQIVEAYSQKHKTTIKNTLAGITKLIQDGGTNTSKPPFSRTVNNITFDLTSLRQTITLYDKKGTVRKLGKTLQYVFIRFAKVNNWPGPLYNDLIRLSTPSNPVNPQDAYACCEIYIKNYSINMPAYIRELLILREAKIRDSRNVTNPSPFKGKGKNKGKKRGT